MGIENNMPEGWKVTNLESCLSSLIDYRGKTPKKSKTGILALSAKSVKMGFIDYNQAYFISPETYKSFMVRGFPKKGDILMTTEAPLGCIAKLDRENITVAQRLLTLRGKSNLLDNDYLMFYLMSRIGQYELKSRASGSTVQGIKRTEFSQVNIILPPLPEQKAIAKVLTAFDSKIELLQSQNKSLETMAQTIFKEWFGKYQIGDELPEGWKVGMLEEIATPLKGRNITKKQVIEGQYPVIAGGLKPSVFHNECNTKSPVITVSASGANAGFVALHHHPVWASDSSYIDISFTNYFYFIYVFLKSSQSLIYDKQEGSAIPHVYPSHLQKLNLIIPTRLELEKFEELAANIFNKISNNKSQIDSLSKTRDTLLPKLMSGQVRVKNIKQTADA